MMARSSRPRATPGLSDEGSGARADRATGDRACRSGGEHAAYLERGYARDEPLQLPALLRDAGDVHVIDEVRAVPIRDVCGFVAAPDHDVGRRTGHERANTGEPERL